jgi:hypothetical protein
MNRLALHAPGQMNLAAATDLAGLTDGISLGKKTTITVLLCLVGTGSSGSIQLYDSAILLCAWLVSVESWVVPSRESLLVSLKMF